MPPVAVKVTLPPAHIEVVPVGETVGAEGVGVTVTTVAVLVAEVQPLKIACTVYVPDELIVRGLVVLPSDQR